MSAPEHESVGCFFCRALGEFAGSSLYFCDGGTDGQARVPYAYDSGAMLYAVRAGRPSSSAAPDAIDRDESPMSLIVALDRAIEQGWLRDDEDDPEFQITEDTTTSFVALQEIALQLSDGEEYSHRHIQPGEYMWWVRNEGDCVYFYDMEGNFGNLYGDEGYEGLEESGLIQMTDEWVSPTGTIHKAEDETGDALERL